MIARILQATLLIPVLLLCGCGGPVRKYDNELRQFGFAYINYNEALRRGPSKVDDLGPYMENNQTVLNLVRNGDIVLIFGARFPTDFPDGASNTLLGYIKEAPERGGSVLLGDGSTRLVTKEEFAKMPRPRKGGS